ncbi:nif-specific transcriptional activator NifA [Rhodomicrobium udaipurense]|uniref:Nif-specific regulatory protein n=1 Tax=Rhodomicrobium udaipurense TaxID=1202716 RepID=A0A8I1GBG5_9HYPH|nr:nif-specific transcriptional activator NifA [Rhodomicrobium udaipurense]MBJ7542700.1 nif-specific transcriptional activator NifA [Rhodomicrobium udaipurense]
MTSSAPAGTVTVPGSVRYSDTALSGIYEISKIVTSPSSLRVMLNNVVSVMSSFLDMRLSTLMLLDKAGDPEIKVSASTEASIDSNEDGDLPLAVIDQIVATASPLVVQNCALHPSFAGWKRLGSAGPNVVQTFIGVPIRVDAKVVGTLAIERVWQGSMDVRIDHDVRFLTMVANLVGQALKLHRVVAEDRERLIHEQHRLAKELSNIKAKAPPPKVTGILGKSRAIRAVTERIEQVAKSNAPVLIRGETGTGKELFARAIHELSRRKGKPFVKVNCAALPEGVIESELFGHEKGAFTGAVGLRKGRFELADGGTIFLDEIGEISPSFQAKLLRILQEGEFERVGGQHTLKINFRLVCATNRALEQMVADGKFRADLYYRINVVPLMLPPLRERQGDIPELAQHFLSRFAEENGYQLTFGPDAMDVLCKCYFPGNIRELENCIRRTAAMTLGDEIHAADFACQHGHCLSSMLWKGPASGEVTYMPPQQHRFTEGNSSQPRVNPPSAPSPYTPPAPEPLEGRNGHGNGHAHGASNGNGVSHNGASHNGKTHNGASHGNGGDAHEDADGGYAQLSKDTLINALEKTGWVQAKAARILGLTPRQVGYALKKHGIEMKRY